MGPKLDLTIQLGEDALWRFEAGKDGALRIFFSKYGKFGDFKEVARFNQFHGHMETIRRADNERS
jgi:hypothetical protein